MVPSLRWGVLATGSIARKFASELPHSRTGRLVAAGSRSMDTARRFAADHPGIRAHGRYEDLLADPEVDAVYISPPHPSHAEWAIKAAAAGKHILCEKPLTLNHREAVEVVEAAHRHGVFLTEAFMYRCHPRTQRAAALVREGIVGRVKLIRVIFSFAAVYDPHSRLFSNALGGGGILDVGCYAASAARLMAGAAAGKPFENPLEVRGAAVLCETGVDAVASAVLKFPGGILAELSCGVDVRQEADLAVYGDKGWLRVPVFWNPPGPILAHDYRSGETQEIATDPCPHKYALEADAVADALPSLESPFMPWADTLGNMETLDLWRESAGQRYDAE